MSLGEKAGYYCKSLGKSCAEGILLAANEEYGLGLTQDEVQLFAGFRTGPGGALAGAVGVLSRLYRQRADLKELCADFSALYERESASSAADGSAAAELAARLLEQYISQQEEPSAAPREEPTDAPLRPEDIKRVKGLGFLQHKGTNKFNGRVITRNGRITADEAQAITDAARHYGDGHLMMTTRLTIEVSGIDYGDIDAFRADLAEAGLETGGTGAKVRPVVSCKGTTCQYGLYDTYALSEEIHQRFYKGYRDVSLPHKFKIAVGGCPNSCIKPSLNDFGIEGRRTPEGVRYQIYVGGTWGRHTRVGDPLPRLVEQEEILPLLEKTLLWFRENAFQRERLGAAIDRLGTAALLSALEGDGLPARREAILAAPLKQRP